MRRCLSAKRHVKYNSTLGQAIATCAVKTEQPSEDRAVLCSEHTASTTSHWKYPNVSIALDLIFSGPPFLKATPFIITGEQFDGAHRP